VARGSEGDAEFSPDELALRWALVFPHRDRALRVARARTSSWADAEDLASEALLRAVRVPTLVEDTVGGLVSTITMRLATDLHRREVTGRQLETRCTVDTTRTEVDERLCDHSEAAWLATQLANLKPHEREVVLHRAAGHTVTSTSQALGLSYKAVESAFTRARGHLRLAWEGTLGAFIFITGALRRLAAKTQPAVMCLQATAWIALAVLVPQVGDTTLSPSDGDRGHSLVPAIVSAPRAASSEQLAGQQLPMATKSTIRSATQAPSSRTPIFHAQVGDRRIVRAGAGVEGRDPNRPFLEQVNDCVHYGIMISPSNIDCGTGP
jgi:RNA polymerase sigma factor (sigma-70 family)